MRSVPTEVLDVVGSGGSSLTVATRRFLEPRFGHDLGHVRVHTGPAAGRAARAVAARAYTLGSDVVFGEGQYDPASPAGRQLIAHELAHVVQQRASRPGPAADRSLAISNPADAAEREADRVADEVLRPPGAEPGSRIVSQPAALYRQVTSVTEMEQEKDPTCPDYAPYRWGPKGSRSGADPAVVASCMPTPMPRGHGGMLGPRPQQDEPTADPEAEKKENEKKPVRESEGKTPPTETQSTSATTATDTQGQPAADEAAGYDFEDDPLSAGGFGPEDETIRVRPGPVRTTLIQARPDLSCSYEIRQIAAFDNAAGPMDLTSLSRDIRQAFTGCDIAYVLIDVVPDPRADDPSGQAIERAEEIKDRLMQATGIAEEDRFHTGLDSGGQGEPQVTVSLGGRNRGSSLGGPGPAASGAQAGKQTGGAQQGDQISAQAGVGDVRHFYTAQAPNAVLYEWLTQLTTAYTKQLHGPNKSGEERQAFAQVQYSLTTKQWTVGFGGQESYVIVLPANLQLSFWAQLMAGTNISTGVGQGSLQAGTQLTWQPADWLAFVFQAGLGPTVQASGPSSIDRTGLISIQIMK